MDFQKGKVYFHKADGRRLVFIEGGPANGKSSFRYLDLKTYDYILADFWDYEVDDVAPMSTNYKMWSLE